MKTNILGSYCFFSFTWDYLNIYLPTQHRGSLETIRSYTDDLTVFRRYLTEELHLKMEKFLFSDVTYDFILDYRNYLVKKNYKPSTVNHRLSIINAYLRYAAMRKPDLIQIYLSVSQVPYVTVPSRIGKIIENKEALERLLSCQKMTRIGIRDQIILVMLYDTAIRAEELIRLNVSDVNLSSSPAYVRVHGKGDKERVVAMTDKTIPLASRYLSVYHKNHCDSSVPFIYTVIKGKISRMSERNVERIVDKYGQRVRKEYPDIPEKIYPHMLRRTRATGWYRDGDPIEMNAVILGHSSVETTRKSYANPSVDMLRDQMEISSFELEAEEPLWKDDEDLAKLCGIR